MALEEGGKEERGGDGGLSVHDDAKDCWYGKKGEGRGETRIITNVLTEERDMAFEVRGRRQSRWVPHLACTRRAGIVCFLRVGSAASSRGRVHKEGSFFFC
jgi:hypothetical protein